MAFMAGLILATHVLVGVSLAFADMLSKRIGNATPAR